MEMKTNINFAKSNRIFSLIAKIRNTKQVISTTLVIPTFKRLKLKLIKIPDWLKSPISDTRQWTRFWKKRTVAFI